MHTRLVALVPILAVLPACAQTETASPPVDAPRLADTLAPADFNAEAILVVHYHRPDEAYDGWNLWSWPEGGNGTAHDPAGTSSYGRYFVIPTTAGTNRQGLLLRLNDWQAKDIDRDRFIDLDADGITEVWLVSGDPRVFADPGSVDLTTRITGAFLDDADSIFVSSTGPLDQAGATVLLDGAPGAYTIASAAKSDRPAAGRVVYELVLDRPVATEDVARLSLEVPGQNEPVTIYARDVLTEDRFTALDANLGPEWTETSTTFRVWSPVASAVEVLLFAEQSDAEPATVVPMTHAGRGVWEAEVAGDHHGTAYQIRYHSYGKARTAADIHCRAANLDSSRSIVVDLARTNPEGWATVPTPDLARPTDEIIWEVHVRDMTIADPTVPPAHRGTYLGLVHEGAFTAPDGSTVQTGLNHLKELGATAVHLLPIHDYTAPLGEYNWGYWTALFNVPESNYASNPHDPFSAPTDLKTAIHGLHAAGIRVILDVVYNHTSTSFEFSPFDQSVPYYYFRTSVDGQLLNDAGVGNAVADERPMVRKFIGDSLVYWASEYRVDGFRFDLLGTHNPDSVAEWLDRVRAVRSDLTIYGEPWTGGGPIRFGKGSQRGMSIAVFNDHIRNALRGDLDGTALGYATGPAGDVAAVRRGIAGAIDDFADQPTETINYVSAHDNLTFWDKLLLARPDASEAENRAIHKLAHGVVLTSQGIAFLHAGADFARTKGGNHNSYNAGDEVNKLDWPRKAEYRDVYDYIRGLIALRRAHPAFRMATRDEVRANLRFWPDAKLPSADLIVYTLDGSAVGDDWATILVAINGTDEPHEITLPAGEWTQVVDQSHAGTDPIRTVKGTLSLQPKSMGVLHR